MGAQAGARGGSMIKHRGFPGRFPGTDFQFTLRRANPKGATPIKARVRYSDRRKDEKDADAYFLACLWDHFGDAPFERGNLDAGRLSWLFGREVVAVDDPFDPTSYDALLRIDEAVARESYPEVFSS